MPEMFTLGEVLERCTEILSDSFGESAPREAGYLVGELCGMSYPSISVGKSKKCVSYEKRKEIIKKAGLRAGNMPLAYITGKAFFMEHEFSVGPDVLIPRRETEILVEETVSLCKGKKIQDILEFCTGSGCICISVDRILEKNGKTAFFAATDISQEALSYSSKNKEKISPQGKIEFILHDVMGDDLSPIKAFREKFDIIVSNPPYVRTREISCLDPDINLYEPLTALDGGKNGMDFYDRIIEISLSLLKRNGYLLFEIGFDQKDDVVGLLEDSGVFDKIYVKEDYSKNPRVVVARYLG